MYAGGWCLPATQSTRNFDIPVHLPWPGEPGSRHHRVFSIPGPGLFPRGSGWAPVISEAKDQPCRRLGWTVLGLEWANIQRVRRMIFSDHIFFNTIKTCNFGLPISNFSSNPSFAMILPWPCCFCNSGTMARGASKDRRDCAFFAFSSPGKLPAAPGRPAPGVPPGISPVEPPPPSGDGPVRATHGSAHVRRIFIFSHTKKPSAKFFPSDEYVSANLRGIQRQRICIVVVVDS